MYIQTRVHVGFESCWRTKKREGVSRPASVEKKFKNRFFKTDRTVRDPKSVMDRLEALSIYSTISDCSIEEFSKVNDKKDRADHEQDKMMKDFYKRVAETASDMEADESISHGQTEINAALLVYSVEKPLYRGKSANEISSYNDTRGA